MAKIIFSVFFGIIKSVVGIMLTPINAIITGLFPGLGLIISTFNNSLVVVVGGTMSWFAYLLPPTTKQLILLWLSILVGYYTIVYSIHAILKIFSIIKTIKFW